MPSRLLLSSGVQRQMISVRKPGFLLAAFLIGACGQAPPDRVERSADPDIATAIAAIQSPLSTMGPASLGDYRLYFNFDSSSYYAKIADPTDRNDKIDELKRGIDLGLRMW